MWAGADIAWHQPIRRNDEILTEAWLKDLVLHDTRFSGRAVQQIYHVDFYTSAGEHLAGADSWCFRTDRDIAREEGTKYAELKEQPLKRYDEAELEAIYRHYAEEEVRGARAPLLRGRQRRRDASHHGQGADDGDRLHRLRPGLGRPLQSAPTSWPGSRSPSIQASASRTSSAFPTARSGCTGRASSPRWSGHRRPTTTVPSAARG